MKTIYKFISKYWYCILITLSGLLFSSIYLIKEYLEFGSIHKLYVHLLKEMRLQHILILLIAPITGVLGYLFARQIHLRDRLFEKEKDIVMTDLIIKAKKEWEETFDVIHDAVTIHDTDFNIIRVNKAAEELIGLPFMEILSKKCYESYHGTNCDPEDCPSRLTLKTGQTSITEIFDPNLNKHLEIRVLPKFDKDNKITGLVHVARDITQNKLMEEELRAMTLKDELTGLYNYRGFKTLAGQQLKLANRLKRGLFLIYADLDGLKSINDNYGHKEGSIALIETSNVFRKSFRESDIIARIGGDEFVILVIESSENIKYYIERLKENVLACNAKAVKPYKLSLSLGIAHYNPEHPHSLAELISKADKLMYEEKRLKNRYTTS